MPLRGRYRDRVLAPGGGVVLETPWRPNLVTWSALDLIGALLCNRSRGVAFLAVGAGDPAWDANPPAADRGRTQLTAETFRVRLEPGRALTYDAGTGRIRARVSIGRGKATGTLRELGLFGGDASPKPGTGVLVNHAVHPALEKGEGDVLQRELVLTLAESLAPGARDLIGGLLARRDGLAGLTQVAFGTSDETPSDPPRELVAEAYRKPIGPTALSYDSASHSVVAGAALEIAEGPPEIREVGLFGGTATERRDTGLLVARETGTAIDRRVPNRLERRFRLVLVEKTDVAVPALVGSTLADAGAAIRSADLQAGPLRHRETEVEPAGTVLEQQPAAEAVVHEGTPVALVVAAVPTVPVPEIVGEPESQARTLLRRLGLDAPEDARVEQESGRPAGTVLACVPPPGTRVPRGTGIALVVAVPSRVSAPDVRGRTPAVAALVLRAAGLELVPEPYPTQESGATAGTILGQDPEPGADVSAGSEVGLTLATPWTIAVPDLRGRTLSEAATILSEAAADLIEQLGLPPDLPGLSLGAISEQADEAPAGTIVAQLPSPDARAFLYGSVDVAVSAVPTKIVPALVGLTRTGAVAALASAELALGTVTHRPARADPDTVVAQEPQAGTGWPRGGRVAITVAGGRSVVVPNLVGLALEAAREALTGLGLSLGTTTPATDPGEPGIVLSQEPAAQTTVGTGTAVNLVVRAGVPNFIGMNLGAASAVLESAGISLQRVDEQEREGPAGIVIAQDPAAGTAATPATSMILVVSIAASLEVPALIGSSLEDARRVLESLGLALEVTDKQESDEAEGSILGQTPESGTLVARGTQVEVLIAVARPQRAAVPELIGLTAEQARAALAQAGLAIEVAGVRPTPRARPGTVVEQEPRVGQVVGAGTVVRVVLASADESIEVPDVRRMHLDAAAPLLERLSLKLRVSDSTGSVEREGTILTQDPVPGTRAPIGSVVSVVVSAGGFVVVPNVVNMLEALAIRRLAGVGLSAEVVGRFSLSRPVGTVLEQTPDAGSHAPAAGLVVIVVARRLITERPIPIEREPIFPAPRPRSPLEPVERPPIILRRPQ